MVRTGLALNDKPERRTHPRARAHARNRFRGSPTRLALNLEDIVTDTHHPQICSVGLPFVFTELRDRAVLERARINISGFDALRDLGVNPQLYLYTRVSDGFDIRARMFAPLSGVLEDPATEAPTAHSAGCWLTIKDSLAGLLVGASRRE